jgi:hypothetical protein
MPVHGRLVDAQGVARNAVIDASEAATHAWTPIAGKLLWIKDFRLVGVGAAG